MDASNMRKSTNALFEMYDVVVTDVGPQNVVQFITDNVVACVAAGRLLTDKYPSMFFTPCAAHCLDITLEDIGKIEWVKAIFQKAHKVTRFVYNHTRVLAIMRSFTGGKELVRPRVTRFATYFLALQTLVEFSKPLVKVLRLVDGDKPPMGYVYKAMDRAKEVIRSKLENNRDRYMPLWDIIDRRWDGQMHTPLNVARYLLNPPLFYKTDFMEIDAEIKQGFFKCIEKMFPDLEEFDAATIELEMETLISTWAKSRTIEEGLPIDLDEIYPEYELIVVDDTVDDDDVDDDYVVADRSLESEDFDLMRQANFGPEWVERIRTCSYPGASSSGPPAL
ncbi:uncharacterized protein LOC131072895 [Cryptomeria japonica]|uniref:uncharacterized protein LOC131072895 n=1 Tax=Cryptomeria japonica TaxID=3369 RepID=UPI0025ACCC62|nr:uncharacterized protein LOC131072895 [Cryptomeria japonica]